MTRANRWRWAAGFVLAVVASAVALAPGLRAAAKEFVESTPRYDVKIQIEPGGSIVVTESIEQDFGDTPRHGIYRDIPDRLRYDETDDRVYPIEVLSVRTSAGTPGDYETFHEDGMFRIRVGDPDVAVTGRHSYEIVYRVEGAMNGFPDHDELYWNAIGSEWEQQIARATVRVTGPADVTRVACSAGPEGSRLPCDKAQVKDGAGVFSQSNLGPYQALSVVVALPPGTVSSTAPILEERWSLDRAFERTPQTVGGTLALLALAVVGFGLLLWRRGRDRRYMGSQVDQVMGSPGGQEQTVPLFESDEGPVEFEPPEGLRPGQVGTLVDEQANTLDVTATIIDLAVRGYLVIQEIPKEGWFGKPDWKLEKQPLPGDELLEYERILYEGLFESGDEVLLSELKKRFVERLTKVRNALYQDAVRRKWFAGQPNNVRAVWVGIGVGVTLLGGALLFVLVRWTHLGLLSLPVVLGGILLMMGARWMPRRTARGTAMVRRIHGFRRVIETAETHLSRWAEQENVFTRFLPYAIVFGCTDKWAEAFEGLAQAPADTGWYVSPRPFAYMAFADSMDSFTVTTSGTIASTPSGSGGSGFGGGGFSGGGGGGGGGGSW